MTTTTFRAQPADTRRPAPVRRTHPPHLRPVPPRHARVRRLPFSLVVIALLAAGFVGLLALNMAAAQDAFREHQLQAQASLLADRQQALQIALDRQTDPHALAVRAKQLGMHPATGLHYLRVRTDATVTEMDGCAGRDPAESVCPQAPPA